MYMLLPVLPFGPRATCPAANVLVNTWKVRGVPSLLRIEVPLSVQLASIHDRRPIRVSTATAMVADRLMVKRASGLAAAALESFAVRIHCAPVSAAGTDVSVKVRSPYWTLPTRRLDCTDQSAALAVSATDSPLIDNSPPPVPTVRLVPAVCVTPAAVPVTVSAEVPSGVPAAVVTVSVELPPAGTGLGLKAAVAPLGRPDALSVTSPGVPPSAAVCTV